MSEKILVPVLGESIVEATVSKWLKNEGDLVEADEPIVELETDKVNLEVPSPTSGVLEKINSKDGSVVEVGATLGSVSVNGVGSKKKEVEESKSIEPNKEEIKIQTFDPKVEETETQLTEDERDLKETIIRFREEELEHRDTAIDFGGETTPGYPVLRKTIRAGSKLAIWLSERF